MGRILLFVLALASICCSKGPVSQKMLPLSPEESQRLESQRNLVKQYLGDADSLKKFESSAGKLGTIRALLATGKFPAEKTHELQSMGVVLGDVFVQDLGFHWILVQDEFGTVPAIQYENTTIILYPLTMISKRVEKGETVDIFDLYNGIANIASEKIEQETGRRPTSHNSM